MTEFNTAQYAFKNAVNLFNDNNLNESIEQLNEILKIHKHSNKKYGFKFAAQIGALKQANEFTDNWMVFFRDKRLISIFELINNSNAMPNHINFKIEKLKRILSILPINHK